MTLIIETPESMTKERNYILQTLLGEFLGLEWVHHPTSRQDIKITQSGNVAASISLPDVLFSTSENKWLDSASLPISSSPLWDTDDLGLDILLVKSVVPVIYGDQEPVSRNNGRNMYLPVDIFGSAFFMLTRYEELIVTDQDDHDRFPATASSAYQNNYLDRPIVDEYVEILWACISELWPDIIRKRRVPKKLISCDLDRPFDCSVATIKGVSRRLAKDIVRDKSPRQALDTILTSYHRWRHDYSSDEYLQAVDWIMDANEKVGNKVAFYFITKHSHHGYDGCYSMTQSVIRGLMRRIVNRGHEVGLHASYNSYRNLDQINCELGELKQALANESIAVDEIGSRQHYLRWSTAITPRYLDAAGVSYDSSLAYADRPGFRCGTCHSFRMYDLKSRKTLTLREKPLILMECSVLGEQYMGLGYSDDALQLMKSYRDVCEQFGGDFTLLWHNSHFESAKDREFYLQLIS
ncbi:polysaccharide deacetylase family protein [Sedimenticola thiotaurini]|uniref:DUF7033 domain-containing protein n=1 Tax=Sedimenticola thiotaurini TaxID=1543721 RepID=A0A0F7K103_9GAMM|nr:polysaccharide deacetylase family protein [Sedimenticola thiotaurini]AKH20845.1 hypothetical protein AAY24_11350 [Sedimenticola thiotaurini]